MEPNTQVVQQAPQEPQSNDEKIGSFARGFLDDLERNQDSAQLDPNDDGQEAQEQQEPQAEPQAEEQPQEEAEEATPQEAEVRLVEVELEDGKRVQVPEELKPHIMRDKDYRQKTMALADQSREVAQLRQKAEQVAQMAEQLAPYNAQLFAMDNHAQQIQQSLTQELLNSDPIEFNRRQGELSLLYRNRDVLAANLDRYRANIAEQTAEVRYKQLAAEAPKLFEEIPELAKPEIREQLGGWVKSQGLNQEEINYIGFSPAATKIAWKARQFDLMQKQQAASKAKLQTAAKVSPTAGNTSRAPDAGAKEKQLRAEWKKGGASVQDDRLADILRHRLRGK